MNVNKWIERSYWLKLRIKARRASQRQPNCSLGAKSNRKLKKSFEILKVCLISKLKCTGRCKSNYLLFVLNLRPKSATFYTLKIFNLQTDYKGCNPVCSNLTIFLGLLSHLTLNWILITLRKCNFIFWRIKIEWIF